MRSVSFLWQAVSFAKKYANRTACLFLSGLLSVWLVTACEKVQTPQKPELPKAKPLDVVDQRFSTLTRGIYSAQFKLDPHFVTMAAEAAPVRDLLKGLMAYDSQGNVVPAVATQWFTDDGKSWLVLLDENARWSNGEAVTANDFVKSWQRLADPTAASPVANYLVYMGVENAKAILARQKNSTELGVEAQNEHTLLIKLEQANYQLPKMLAHTALLPTYLGKKPESSQLLVSNGEYRVIEQQPLQLRLEAISPNTAFKQVNYQLLYSNQDTDLVDIVENPLANYQGNLTALPRLCTYFYEFNLNDPVLKQREVRQAIKTMLQHNDLLQSQVNAGLENTSILPKTMKVPSNEWRASQAAEMLLSQAGVSMHNPVKLTLTYDNQGQHPVIAYNVLRALAQSDLFQVSQNPVEWTKLLQLRDQGQFQMIRSGWCADYPDPVQFLNPFHSASPDNKMGYRNSNVDAQLEQLRSTELAEDQRERLIRAVTQQIEDDVAIVPIFQYQRYVGVSDSVKGIALTNPSEVIYSKDLYREGAK